MAAKRRERRWRPRRDWGRLVAVALCVLFAVIGAVPLGLGFLVRTGPVRTCAAQKTSALLARELGVKARYELRGESPEEVTYLTTVPRNVDIDRISSSLTGLVKSGGAVDWSEKKPKDNGAGLE